MANSLKLRRLWATWQKIGLDLSPLYNSNIIGTVALFGGLGVTWHDSVVTAKSPQLVCHLPDVGKIMGYVTRTGHGYRWSGYGYGLEIPTHQKPLPVGRVGMGWCGFFSSNLHRFQAHQCTPPSSTPPASESLFTMSIDSIIHAPQHAPPSSSLPVVETLFVTCHFSNLTNALLPFPLKLLAHHLCLPTI